MPEVELCYICGKEIDEDNEKFVVVSPQTEKAVRVLAHLECQQARHSRPRTGRTV
jgi:hypothetical protein